MLTLPMHYTWLILIAPDSKHWKAPTLLLSVAAHLPSSAPRTGQLGVR